MAFIELLAGALIYQAPKESSYTAEFPQKCFPLTTKSGKVTYSMFLPSKNPQEKRVLLYSHGNGTDMGICYDLLVIFRDRLGINVMHYEYLGYGLTKETAVPNEQDNYECAEAAMIYLLSQNFAEENIILHGTSLGTAMTIYLASLYKKVQAVILEAPLMSICTTFTNIFLVKLFDIYESYMRIGGVEARVFIMHGTEDSVVPLEQFVKCSFLLHSAIELHKRCKKSYPILIVEQAGHNNYREKLGYAEYFKRIKQFLDDVFIVGAEVRKAE